MTISLRVLFCKPNLDDTENLSCTVLNSKYQIAILFYLDSLFDVTGLFLFIMIEQCKYIS